MALAYGHLGLLAEARQQPRQAVGQTVTCVALTNQVIGLDGGMHLR